MSETWSDYMKKHGAEEYAAWDAAVRPYTERIAALTQQRDSAQALLKDAVEVLGDAEDTLNFCVEHAHGCSDSHKRAHWGRQDVRVFLSRPELKAMGGRG